MRRKGHNPHAGQISRLHRMEITGERSAMCSCGCAQFVSLADSLDEIYNKLRAEYEAHTEWVKKYRALDTVAEPMTIETYAKLWGEFLRTHTISEAPER